MLKTCKQKAFVIALAITAIPLFVAFVIFHLPEFVLYFIAMVVFYVLYRLLLEELEAKEKLNKKRD